MGLYRQEYWSGLPLPSPEESVSLTNSMTLDPSIGCKPSSAVQSQPLNRFTFSSAWVGVICIFVNRQASASILPAEAH